jgi:sortase A
MTDHTMRTPLSTIVGVIGRTLIGTGLVVLAFAAYQLWGTGFLEARSQDGLESEFAARQAAVTELGENPVTGVGADTGSAEPGAASGVATSSTLPLELAPELARELLPEPGDSLGFIRIPSIGVERAVVEGVRRDDLRKGPGHYSNTPLPGQAGNAAIAGHRTTYGQPFYDLDKLQPGDLIEVETLQGIFFYEVMGHPDGSGVERGHFIVEPTRVDVVEDFGDNRLTLTACHPKRSARQRIVVTAQMVGAPAPTITVASTGPTDRPGDDEPAATDLDDTDLDDTDLGGVPGSDEPGPGEEDEESLEESLGWNTDELRPTLLWGALAGLVLLAGWLIGRAWRRVPAYVLTAPVFLGVLFVSFVHLDRMLPAF